MPAGAWVAGNPAAGNPMAGSSAGRAAITVGRSCANFGAGRPRAELVRSGRTDSAASGLASPCGVDVCRGTRAEVADVAAVTDVVLIAAVSPVAPGPVATACTAPVAPTSDPLVTTAEDAGADRVCADPAMVRCAAGTLVPAETVDEGGDAATGR